MALSILAISIEMASSPNLLYQNLMENLVVMIKCVQYKFMKSILM